MPRAKPHQVIVQENRRPNDSTPAQPLRARPAVLIVDDDLGTRQTVDWVLRQAGYHVGMASSGTEGMAMARSGKFDLLLIDFQLPDMLGTNLARAIRSELAPVPFILISGWLKTEVTVEAMRLGASNVIDKPIAIEAFPAIVGSALGGRFADHGLEPPHRRSAAVRGPVLMSDGMRPRSAAERWAGHVLKACESEGDLKTVGDWATCARVSTSSLCESCHLLGIQPRDARDFARILRALIKAGIHHCEPEVLLDVSDRRTLTTLLQRGGVVTRTPSGALSVGEFLRTQRFISGDNEGLNILRTLLRSQPLPDQE
jgi:DNA-binding response OmpR family regulator